MVKHTETIRRLLPSNRLSVFNRFVGLTLKGLRLVFSNLASIPFGQNTPFRVNVVIYFNFFQYTAACTGKLG